MTDWLQGLASSSVDGAEAGRAALVRITSRGRGEGSGILWGRGLILTNAHVAQARKLQAILPGGRQVRSERIAWDPSTDLAALRFEGDEAGGRIGDSDSLRPGEWVYAIGHPWGVRGAVTGGTVIGHVRAPRRVGQALVLLAMSLHLRPGHSGGPVVNARGEIVGINTMMNGPDVGLAVPSSRIVRFLAEHRLSNGETAGKMAA